MLRGLSWPDVDSSVIAAGLSCPALLELDSVMAAAGLSSPSLLVSVIEAHADNIAPADKIAKTPNFRFILNLRCCVNDSP